MPGYGEEVVAINVDAVHEVSAVLCATSDEVAACNFDVEDDVDVDVDVEGVEIRAARTDEEDSKVPFLAAPAKFGLFVEEAVALETPIVA